MGRSKADSCRGKSEPRTRVVLAAADKVNAHFLGVVREGDVRLGGEERVLPRERARGNDLVGGNREVLEEEGHAAGVEQSQLDLARALGRVADAGHKVEAQLETLVLLDNGDGEGVVRVGLGGTGGAGRYRRFQLWHGDANETEGFPGMQRSLTLVMPVHERVISSSALTISFGETSIDKAWTDATANTATQTSASTLWATRICVGRRDTESEISDTR